MFAHLGSFELHRSALRHHLRQLHSSAAPPPVPRLQLLTDLDDRAQRRPQFLPEFRQRVLDRWRR
jgi:hypothetical protein